MKKSLILVIIVALVGLVVYNKVFIPKHTFSVVSATKGDVAVQVNGIGNVSSKETYNIGSIYGGKISNFTVNEGEFVKKGTLIATVDYVDLDDKIDELKSTIKKLHSDIESLKVDKQSAIVDFDYQEELFKKNEALFKKHAISQLDFKKFQTTKDVAKLKIASISSKIKSLYAQISQIQANIDGLNKRLKRYNIVADVSGYVMKKLVSNYQIIMPNQTLIQIVNPKDVWIATHIDTRISGKVKVGDSATIVLQSSNIKYTGKVVNINPINNSITYEREIDVKFDNLPIPFYLEEQASVNIGINTLRDVVKIPLRALSIYKKQQGVWILDKDKVIFKPISILAQTDENIATKDISTNDTLVIPNPKNKPLSNGMKIYIKR